MGGRVTLFVLNDADTPEEGETERTIVPENPLRLVRVMSDVV